MKNYVLLFIGLFMLIFSIIMGFLKKEDNVTEKNNKKEEEKKEPIYDQKYIQDSMCKESPDRITELTQELCVDEPDDQYIGLIDIIIYINLSRSPDRNERMKKMLKSMKFSKQNTRIFRLEGIANSKSGAKGCYLSHLHVLAWALCHHPQKRILVLEDDFHFHREKNEILNLVKETDVVLKKKWDVIQLGLHAYHWQRIDVPMKHSKLFRILNSTTTSSFLVNTDYVQILFNKWMDEFEKRKHKEKFVHEDNLDQIQQDFQKVDFWVGYNIEIGEQLQGKSTITDRIDHNSWRCNETFDKSFDAYGKTHKLKLESELLKLQNIIICLSFSNYKEEFINSFKLKPHHLQFVVFYKETEEKKVQFLLKEEDKIQFFKVENEDYIKNCKNISSYLEKFDYVFYMLKLHDDPQYYSNLSLLSKKMYLSNDIVGGPILKFLEFIK